MLDADTYILTYTGWKKYNEINKNTKIATYHIGSGTMKYEKPYGIYTLEYNGPMYLFENTNLSMCLTPKHSILCREYSSRFSKDKSQEKMMWSFIQAENILERNQYAFPNSSIYDGPDSIGIDFASLLGWIITEGRINKRVIEIYQSCSANPEKVQMIRDILDRLEIKYSYKEQVKTSIDIKKAQLLARFYIHVNQPYYDKILTYLDKKKEPPWSLLHLKKAELDAMYDAMILGDGTRYHSKLDKFYQKNRHTLDWFATLCIKTGRRAIMSTAHDCIHSSMRQYSFVRFSSMKNFIHTFNYEDIVWCVYVPNSCIFIRRQGADGRNKYSITGNGNDI